MPSASRATSGASRLPRRAAPDPASARRRLPAPERRAQIVASAFDVLATLGFEGLRMRDVAGAVDLNSATLHHYFPTKQDLVEAVAHHLAERFAAVRAPGLPEHPDVPAPLRRLRQEFADAQYCRAHHPDLLAASRELALRGTRDPAVATAVAPLHAHWRAAIADVLRDGQHAGVFRPALDPRATGAAVVAALWGMGTLLQLSEPEFAAGCAALEAAVRA